VAERRRFAVASAAAVLAVTALAGCSTADTSTFTGERLDPPFEVSGADLVRGDDGSSYSLTGSTDKPLTLVFFGYTHCPDICQQVMSTMASAMTRLSQEDRAEVDVVFVTTDPARDDEQAVTSYATAYDDDFVGLTGDLPTIIDVAASVAIGVEKGDKLPSGGYDVTHGTQVMGVGADDTAHAYWGQDVSSAQLAADIHTLLSE
jgi:protein SCO1/2